MTQLDDLLNMGEVELRVFSVKCMKGWLVPCGCYLGLKELRPPSPSSPPSPHSQWEPQHTNRHGGLVVKASAS